MAELYINGIKSDSKTYTQDVNDTQAFSQTLLYGDDITDVSLNSVQQHKLAEQSQNPNNLYGDGRTFYKFEKHYYWKVNESGTVFIEDKDDVTQISANRMPMRFMGWETQNHGSIPSTLTDDGSFITNNFDSNHQMTVYGTWETVHMIRVIVYIPDYSSYPVCLPCKVIITPTDSYDENTPYHLTENYKFISDYSNNIEFSVDGKPGLEFGVGHASPSNGIPTYYGVIDDETSVSMELTPDIQSIGRFGRNYIPWYEYNPRDHTTKYKCYYAPNLVRYVEHPWEQTAYGELTLVIDNTFQKWSTSIGNIETDVTIVVPLKRKTHITVEGYDGDDANLSINKNYFRPEETVTLTATVTAGRTFVGWYTEVNNVIEPDPRSHDLVYEPYAGDEDMVYYGRFDQNQIAH